MKIIFGFSRPRKWKPFAWLIMTSYNTPYSHVYVKLWSDKYQRFLIYQASHTTVNFMGSIVFETDNEVIKEFELPLSDEARLRIMQFAIDTVGKPYGMKEVIGLAIVKVASWLGKEIKNPLKDGNSTFACSPLGGIILQDYLNVKIDKDPEDLTPKDVYDLLSAITKNNTIDNNT